MIWFSLLVFLVLPFTVQVRALILPAVAALFIFSGAADWVIAHIDGPEPVQVSSPTAPPKKLLTFDDTLPGGTSQPVVNGSGNMFIVYKN